MQHCGICKRLLNDPTDPVLSGDCGGDCSACIFVIEHLDYDPGDYPPDDELRPVMEGFYRATKDWDWEFTPPSMPLEHLKQWIKENDPR